MKHRLLYSTMLASMACSLTINAAHAQSTDADQPDQVNQQKEDDGSDVIVVTGSRIGRSGEDISAPLQTITSEDFRKRGYTSVVDALNELTSVPVGSGLGGATGATGSTNAGIETVNLRGLSTTAGAGASRTLTLVNGRRHVAGVAGTSAVDISSIPAAMVERIETITGGSSAVYGSEAIAGVVNIILKKDFEGLELAAQYGLTDRGDGEEFLGSLAWGTDIGDRGNLSIGFQYSDQSPAFVSNRRFLDLAGLAEAVSIVDIVNPMTFETVTTTGLFQDVRDGSTTTGGLPRRFGMFLTDAMGTPLQFGPGGTLIPFDIGTPVDPATPTDPSFAFPRFPQTVGGDGVPLGIQHAGSLISSPSERYLGTFNFNYELSDVTNFFVEGKYSRSDSAFVAQIPRVLNIAIGGDNPFLDPAAAAIINAGFGPVAINRQFDELAPLSGSAENETIRFVAGFDGQINDDLNWAIHYNYGRSERNESVLDYDMTRIAQAADATTLAGNMVCRNQANGCIPLNILGGGQTFSPAALDFITRRPTRNSVIDQNVIGASLDGTITELPGGPLQFAAGVEYRRDSLDFNPDALAQTPGGFQLTGGVPTSGEIDTFEFFGELNVPILEGRPGIENLNLDISARYGDYNTVGGTFSWKVGGTYSPIRGLNFRAAYGTSVRAPNINETTPAIGTTVQFAPDLCSAQNLAGGPNRAANCATLTVSPLIAPFVPISINSIANPNLQEETADTLTLGVDYSPDFIPGLTLSANYFSIDISDAIDRVDFFRIQELCYDSDPAFVPNGACGQIIRDPVTGSVTSITEQFDNLATLDTSGFDLSAVYNTNIPSVGQLSLSATATFLDSFDQGNPFGTGVERLAGRGSLSKFRLVGSVGLTSGDFSGFVNVRHQNSTLDDEFSGGGLEVTLPSVTYVDGSISWTLADDYTLTVGVSNVFDQEPPINIRTLHPSYDVFGRRYFARISAKIF